MTTDKRFNFLANNHLQTTPPFGNGGKMMPKEHTIRLTMLEESHPMNPVWLWHATALTDALMSREVTLTEIPSGAALLDFSNQDEAISREILAKVAKEFGPALYLNRDLLLIVNIATIDSKIASKVIAEAIDPDVRKTIRLARVTGESIIDQIEELAAEGIPLHNDSEQALIEQSTAPTSVLAQIPASTISDALVEGAQILISHTASPGTMALGAFGGFNQSEFTHVTPEFAASIAAVGKVIISPLPTKTNSKKSLIKGSIDANGLVSLLNTTLEPITVEEDLTDFNYQASWESIEGTLQIASVETELKNDQIPITATFTEGYELACLIHSKDNELQILKTQLSKFPSVECKKSGQNHIELNSRGEKESLLAIASRLDLLLHELGLSYNPSPLSQAIRPFNKVWNSTVPREKLLFGQECRYLCDWLSK